MDLIQQYEIPYLHPLAVHFPLVLLLLGAAAATLYAALGRGVWRRAALIFFLLGTAGAWAAERTGHVLAEAVEGDPIVDQIVDRHAAAAEWTVLTSAFAAFAFTGLSLVAVLRKPKPVAEGDEAPPVRTREPLWGRFFALIPAVAAAVLVAWTAHLGGIMVWGIPR
ncbi:MAG: DUF2231 domain-containing protein [Bacteroidota bacterium]